jgi:hypothetical protein
MMGNVTGTLTAVTNVSLRVPHVGALCNDVTNVTGGRPSFSDRPSRKTGPHPFRCPCVGRFIQMTKSVACDAFQRGFKCPLNHLHRHLTERHRRLATCHRKLNAGGARWSML